MFELQVPFGYTLDYFMPNKGYTTTDNTGNFDPMGRNNLLAKQNKARDIVLSNNYDYLLFIEEDMVIPANTIELLLACNSQVAYGLYVFRRQPYMVSCWVGIEENSIFGLSIDKFPTAYQKAYNSIVDCDGVGFGCTLIHRTVLETFPFRVGWDEKTKTGAIPHSDMWFSADCIRYGITQRCNLECKCGHITQVNENNEPIASIMFPDKDNVVTFIPYDEVEIL
jgi:hypothetical protein